MTKKKLDQFRGKLTPAKIAAGMTAACANAHRLAKAARLLLENGHYALSASIAAISIEEAGKPTILRALAMATSEQQLSQCWRDFRTHTRKNLMWLLPQLVSQGARKLDDFRPLFEDDAEHPFLLDQVKQIGFYTDCLGKAHWSIPSDVIDKSLATMMVSIAEILGKEKSHSETEVQLWIKHMAHVQKRPKELVEHALAQWYKDMQAHGLLPEGKNEMEDFILTGLHKRNPGSPEQGDG